jgi:hypothetical protein
MRGRHFIRLAGVLLALGAVRARAEAPAPGDTVGGLLAAVAAADFPRAQVVAGTLSARGRSLAQIFGTDPLPPLVEALAARSPARATAAAARFAVTDVRGQLRAGLALEHHDAVRQAVTAAFAAYNTLAKHLPAELLDRDREIKRLFHSLFQALSTSGYGAGTPARAKVSLFGGQLDERLAALVPAPVSAAGSEVAAARQATMLLRALAYDTNLITGTDAPLVVLVLYNATDAVSTRAAETMTAAFKAFESTTVQGRPVSVRRQAFAGAPALRSEVTVGKVAALYLCPALDGDLAAISEVSRSVKVRTLASLGAYLDRGASLGVFENAGRVAVTVNLTASRLEGAAFSPDLLRVAHVMP